MQYGNSHSGSNLATCKAILLFHFLDILAGHYALGVFFFLFTILILHACLEFLVLEFAGTAKPV